MKNAIVDFPISMASFMGIIVLAFGIIVVVTSSPLLPFLGVQDKRLLPFELVYLGVILVLVGMGLIIFGVARGSKRNKEYSVPSNEGTH